MIIGKDFAWGHIPRTGGDITAELFQLVHGFCGNVIIEDDGLGKQSKHDTFDQRGIPDDMPCILNIRCLPSFVMSWVFICAGRLRRRDEKHFGGGVWPSYHTLPVPTRRQLLTPGVPYGPKYFHKHYGGCFATLPDFLLNRYAGERPVLWFRLEHLKDDFLDFIMPRYSLTGAQVSAIRQHKYTLKRPLGYRHRIDKFFSPSEIETLYANNPMWSNVERAGDAGEGKE